MSRIIQPAVAKRIAFATWARKNHVKKMSSATYSVPESIDVPETLMVGAQIDGKVPPETGDKKAPKRTRVRKTKDRGPVEEPGPPVQPEPEVVTTSPDTAASSTESEHVFNPVDYPQHQEAPQAQQEE